MILARVFYIASTMHLMIGCVYHDTDPARNPQVIEFSCDTISWQKHILPIMTNSCALNDCHDGISRLDWRSHAFVKQYSGLIRIMTGDRSMPVDSRLPQQQIDMIHCWIDKGAPEN